MRKGLVVAVFGLVGLVGCTPVGAGSVDEKSPVSPAQPEPGGTAEADPVPVAEPEPEPEPLADPVADPKAATIAVQMTSATLADDCGGGPNTPPPAGALKRESKSKSKRKGDSRGASARKAKRRCEQSSIQLAIDAPADSKPAAIVVKSVELLLESGKSAGKLEARAPSVWSDPDGYKPWNERVEPSQALSVTYALSRPDWSQVEDRWNQTYTVKAVISIAGADQTVEHSVVVNAPTSLPPGVKT